MLVQKHRSNIIASGWDPVNLICFVKYLIWGVPLSSFGRHGYIPPATLNARRLSQFPGLTGGRVLWVGGVLEIPRSGFEPVGNDRPRRVVNADPKQGQ